MSAFTDRPETAAGRALFAELLWVHGKIREDLETVRRLAAECDAGRPGEQLAAEIEELETNGPLWQLKVNCLHYCRFVHGHHGAEDALFFPRIRAANPEIGDVVDRLEAEHRDVSSLLDEVEGSARALSAREGEAARRRLGGGLNALADTLLAHLSFEEQNLRPTISRMHGGL